MLKTAIDDGGTARYTVYIFETLELRRSTWVDVDPGVPQVFDYELTNETEVPYLFANGVRLGRIVYEADSPEIAGDETHVFLELGDHLGSTSIVIDKKTSELVERSTTYAYGGTESDYRPARWNFFREDYRFTGKEEDVEVGLQYFGKRFYAPMLQRWVSADPLAVHVPGKVDPNGYAYVAGAALKAIDPLGLAPDFDFTRRNDFERRAYTGGGAAVINWLVDKGADLAGQLAGPGEPFVRPYLQRAAGRAKFEEPKDPVERGGYRGGQQAGTAFDVAAATAGAANLARYGARAAASLIKSAPKLRDQLAALEETVSRVLRDQTGSFRLGPGGQVFSTAGRAAELKAAIPENSRGYITMAVALVEDAKGNRSILIGTSEPNGYLRPGVTLNDGETLVPGLKHAEKDLTNYAEQKGLRVLEIGATRPVCDDCADAISPTGADITTPLKHPRE